MSNEPVLDIDFARAQFPAFSHPELRGWAFFENAGGSYACRQTIERLTAYYTRRKVQPYATYPASAAAGMEMDGAHARLAALMNVEAEELHVGPSTSQNTVTLANAFRATWTDGDEVIVTNQDHEANSGVWRRLADRGITVKEWQVDPERGILDPAELASLLTDRTRLVAFPHCSNIVGHENPVADIMALVHSAGAVGVVDGVSAAPHGLADVGALGADVYLYSAYKTYGPHQGVFTVRRSVMEGLVNQSHYFNDGEVHKRMVPAGPDHAQVAALQGVADYIDELHDHHFDATPDAAERGRRVHRLMRSREVTLLTPLLDYLSSRSDLRILGPTDPSVRVPTVAMTTRTHPLEIARRLGDHKVMCDAGDFYAVRVIEAMGVPIDPGVLRLSFVHYTTEAEIDQLIRALDAEL